MHVKPLGQEQQVLASRLVTANKKFMLVSKIRNAKANAAGKNVNKQLSEQLEAANREVDTAQKDVWTLQERANEVNQKLLEHHV